MTYEQLADVCAAPVPNGIEMGALYARVAGRFDAADRLENTAQAIRCGYLPFDSSSWTVLAEDMFAGRNGAPENGQ